MASNNDLVKEPTRHIFAYKIPTIDVSELKRLSSHLNGIVLRDFNKDYGNLLSILHTSVDPMALITLFQFYDPKLRCFTFQDYQLVPTLEEYSYLLDIKVADEVPFVQVPEKVKFEVIAEALHMIWKEVKDNWKSNGDTFGFYLSFLVRKSEDLARKGEWGDFSLLFALMIYGIVLFPHKENFVDLASICVFMTKNPMPTLLADTYYSIHSRHGKKGNVGLCHLMLYQWFMLHLPVSGTFVDTESSLRWASRLVNLTSFDIRWNYVMGEVRNIITSCGEFSNVPLMGTKGCINYNPVLAYRQLGYAMDDEPKDVEVSESVYFSKGDNFEMLGKVMYAWRRIHRRDKFTLSKKVPVARIPYIEWVKRRFGTLRLPFSRTQTLRLPFSKRGLDFRLR